MSADAPTAIAMKAYTLDIAQLAALIGVDSSTLYRDAADGYIEVANGEYVRVLRRGRRVFVGRAQVDAALARASA